MNAQLKSLCRTHAPLLLSGVLLAAASSASAQRYDVFGIGTLYLESAALRISDAGKVAGWSYTPGGGPMLAVCWLDGNLVALGPRVASDVNTVGHVVGRNETSQAVIWKWGQPLVIGAPPGFTTSDAVAINDLDQVACNAMTSGSRRVAFLWEDLVFRDLGTLGGIHCNATDMNDLTQIVGDSTIASGFEHAFLWSDGIMTDLGVLEGDTHSWATSVNNTGEVIGWSSGPGGDTPCLWIAGEPQPLPRLPGDRWTMPQGINDGGVIVGTASIDLNERAVMWFENEIVDLNELVFGTGWVLQSALDINNEGWIVGIGRHDGVREGYVLIPSPILDSDPLFAGQPVNIRYRNGTPDSPAFLAYSVAGFGSTYIPPLGVELQLHRPAFAAQGRTDANGDLDWTLDVPPGTTGRRVLLQAAQLSRTSNVVSHIIQ